MLAYVQDGKLLRVAGNPENPYTAGSLCRKVAHYEERVYSPDRLTTPLRRVGKKGEGRFEPIAWEEAIETIATRWKQIIAETGPEAIQPYSYAGTMGVVSMSACDGRLWNRMGASRLLRTICSSAAEAGYTYVNGWSGGIDPEDFANSKFILVWGTNLSSTNVHLMPFLKTAQSRGATVVVIDPYQTRTANSADWFIQPRPGTDGALALGMAHVLFAEGLHDEAWLEAHSVGWCEFRERCAEYTPERVAEITDLKAEEIVTLARRYATEQPSAIRLGYGLSRTANGGSMIRAISTLPALIGAWGKRGSGLLLSSSAHFPLNRQAIARPDLQPAEGEPSCRDYGRSEPRALNMTNIGKEMAERNDPPVRALYVYNSNPAAVAPNANLVCEQLAREDIFLVVHEQMMTDTAQYADILLPATTQMEHLDLMRAYGHLYLNLCTPAIAPLGESRPNIEVLNALAKAMGYTDSAFDQPAEEIIRSALDHNHPLLEGITYEALQEQGFAKLKATTDPYIPFTNGEGFRTPSGKVEIYSERAKADGYDPLPDYYPPAESSEADPAHAAQFPINLLSPAAHHFLNSTFSNQESLQKSERAPRIWINSSDAEAREIEEGDWVRVWNLRGEVRLQAVVGEKVKPGVAWSPSLWWHRDSPKRANVNVLTSDRLTDMGEGSTFHTNLVQIEKVETGM
jgi:anaerobic selenocysteine-containing dehydrogenase